MSGLENSLMPRSATRALRVPIEVTPPAGAIPVKQVDESGDVENPYTEPLRTDVCSADVARDDLTGFSLGQYALGKKVGDGGMGKVFLARHRHLDRLFAIKFVAADLSANVEAQDRFERETRALGRLQHPNIVNAVDAGCVNGLRYLVTEFIEGEDLDRLICRRGKLPVEEACELIRQAAVGLAYSHANGFVHRDIKPSNLIVNQDGVVKILDFGLVQTTTVNHRLTSNQEMLGTWDFLAPEQAQDASQVDCRSDIYSLGCTLIFLLSGDVPFRDTKYASGAAKLRGHLFDTPEWLQHPPRNIPQSLINILIRMVAKSPAMRFQTANELVEAFEGINGPAAIAPVVQQEITANPIEIVPRRRLHRTKVRLFRPLLTILSLTFIFVWPGFIRIRFFNVKEAPVIVPDRTMPVAESAVSSHLVVAADQLAVKETLPQYQPIKAVIEPGPVEEPVEIVSFQDFKPKGVRSAVISRPEPIRSDGLLITPFPRRQSGR